jgi:hypothetical protein
LIITNFSNLPDPLVQAVSRDPYNAGASDISVTKLISPPRKVALEKQHANELTEDAADRLYALLGQIGHLILERSGRQGMIEKRFFTTMDGWILSGQVDILMQSATIIDYKFTSVYTVKDGLKPEWEQQINLLAMLALDNGHAINAGQIVAIFRDWSTLKAKRDHTYPQQQVQVLNVPLWSLEEVRRFTRERIAAHQAAQEGNLPECTADERWERGAEFAVMKKGRKRAVKLHDNPTAAEQHAFELGTGHSVEPRAAQQVRCENYCAAFPFCEQGKRLVGNGAQPEPDEEPA